MPDSNPDADSIFEEIRSSDRFSEMVEEIADHFHNQEYKDDRIPEIKASFREKAEEAGLSEGEANGVAGRLIGALTSAAEEEAPPPPESKWDALEPESGPLPEDRYDELPGPFYQLLRLVETETEPFRQVHRLIDAVEWAVKWHTTLALSDLLAQGDVPEPVKVLLAEKLQTPSLGTWNRFFRNAVGAFKDIDADPALPWDRFERLTGLEGEHHLVNFRNRYGHGATPPPEECREDVETYRPILRELINTPLFTDVGLAVRSKGETPQRLAGPDREPAEDELETDLPEGHAAAILPEASGRAQIDLWPLGLAASPDPDDAQGIETVEAGQAQFFFFNALRNRKAVEQLNYEGPVHRRDEGLYEPFMGELPLRAWREETSAELEDFAHEVAALTESFKGRRSERARLRGFAAGGEGTLMVYGAPGIGKSALLAQVVREIEAGVDADGRDLTDGNGDPIDPPPVIEFFIRRAEGKDDPTRFLRYLCRHLDERYDLDGQGLGNEPVELQEQLSARLQAIEENADDDPKRTVLLVDGLDEAPELGRYVPEARPWLPVIVASRETPEATDFYEGRRRETRSQMTVGPLGRREVRAILYEGTNKYDPAFDEEYVEAVAERSEGNPLYLTLLAEALFQGEIEVGDIDSLPEKIGELYGEAVRRVTDEGENQTALDLLHLLAEAKAPLTAGAIGELLEINAMQASSAVRAAMELLHEASPEALYPTSEDAPEEAVQLFHESLREWLRGKEEHAEACRKMKKRLAGKTADWGERSNETARRYTLRYGALHQREAGKPDELYDLLTGESYQDEQVRAFKQYGATFASYEAGLEAYVERDGETPEDDARLCRLALDAGQAAREAKEGVTQAFRWAEEERMEDALQRIGVLGEEKYFLAALRLLWIEADRQAEKPEEERSAETAEKVLDAVEERIPSGTEAIDWSEFVDEDLMAWWSGRVLQTLTDIDVTGILKRTSEPENLVGALIRKIREADGSYEALTRITCRSVKAIPEALRRTEFFSDLAAALAESSAFSKALDVARSINRDSDRDEALSKVAVALAEAGQAEQALDAAQSIDSDLHHVEAQALSNVASAMARADAFEQALDAARSIDSDRHRAEALSVVASAISRNAPLQKTRPLLEQALDAVQSIDFILDSNRADTLCRMASALAEAGSFQQTRPLFEQALDAARSIDLDRHRTEALSNVASALARADQPEKAENAFEQALNSARSIGDGSDRAEALRGVTSALAEASSFQQTRPLFEQILDASRSIDDGSRRSRVLREVASALARADQPEQAENAFEQALNSARSIGDSSDRAEDVSKIAVALAEASAFDEALNAARSINPDAVSFKNALVETLSRVASALAKADSFNQTRPLFDQALGAARSIDSDHYDNNARAEALSKVASALAEADSFNQTRPLFDQALSAARSSDWEPDRAEALSGVASALAQTGQYEQAESALDEALEAAQSIDRDSDCADALSGVVCVLVDAWPQRAENAFEQTLIAARSVDRNSDRAEALSDVISALAEDGSFEQALDAARSIDSGTDRSRALCEVASAHAKVGQFEQEENALEQALDAARSIDGDYHRAEALRGVTSALAEASSFQQARPFFEQILDASRSIDDGSRRSRVLREVASALARADQPEQAESAFEQALNSARSIDDGSDRAEALSEVASALAEVSSFQQARPLFHQAFDVARSVGNDPDRTEALHNVAFTLPQAGSFQQARPFFEQILDASRSIDDSWRPRVLRGVAFWLSEAGSFQQARPLFHQALDIAQSIDSDSDRAKALSEVASTLGEAGSFDQTQPLFEQILNAARSIDTSHASWILSDIASALAQAGSFQQTRLLFEQTIQAVRSYGHSWVLSHVASALAEASALSKALDVARSINRDYDRAEALSEVAPALAEASQSEQAENALEQALDSARSIDDSSRRSSTLREVASALAEIGFFDRALDVVRSINPDAGISDRARALSEVASALARADALEQALESVRSIADLSRRASTVEEIAEHQAKDGRAEAFAKHLSDLELAHDGWKDLLPTWREALLEHGENPRPLLCQSLTLYPFDAEAAAEGTYSLVQAHVQAGAMDHAEAIARECPELELGVLVQDPDPPIPGGCDPEMLSGFFKQQFEDLVESYKQGDLGDAAFKENAENIFKAADPE